MNFLVGVVIKVRGGSVVLVNSIVGRVVDWDLHSWLPEGAGVVVIDCNDGGSFVKDLVLQVRS